MALRNQVTVRVWLSMPGISGKAARQPSSAGRDKSSTDGLKSESQHPKSFGGMTLDQESGFPPAWSNASSVFAAMMKSLRCSPPMACVHQVTVTLPHAVRMVG